MSAAVLSMSVMGSAATRTHRTGGLGAGGQTTHFGAEELRVREEEWGVEPVDDQPRYLLGFGEADEVVVPLESRHPAQDGVVRPPGQADEVEQRQPDGDGDTLKDPQHRHGEEGGQREVELRAALVEEPADALDLDQAECRPDDHGAQRRRGQVLQQPGREDDQGGDGRRPDDARQLGLGPRRLGHRRARRAAADREALEQAGCGVGKPQRDEFAVGVDLVAAAQGERARDHTGVGEGHESDSQSSGEHHPEVADVDLRERERRQTLGQAAHDRDALRSEVEDADRHRGQDDGDQHPGHAGRHALEPQDERQTPQPDRERLRLDQAVDHPADHLGHAGQRLLGADRETQGAWATG